MGNEKYLLVAKNLADRNKNRLDTERSPKEQEKDKLFYWLISRLESSMEGHRPPKTYYSVTVKETSCYGVDAVQLKHGIVSNYLSEYVSRNEFYTVVEEVVKAFNEMGELQKIGYYFSATCLKEQGDISITVHMATE